MTTQNGAVFFDVREVQGVVVSKGGSWALGVKASWGLVDKSSSSADWWKANSSSTADWSSAKVSIPVSYSGSDDIYLLQGDCQFEGARSRLVPLDESALTLLVNTQLKVELYGQPAAHGSEDALLGRAYVPLHSLITGEPGLDAVVSLDGEGGGSVRVRVYLDDELAAYAAHSSTLQVGGAGLFPLPASWALPAPPNTPPEAMEQALAEQATGALGAKQQYTVVISASAESGNSKHPPFRPLMLPGGRIAYGEGGQWSISWPDPSQAAWLSAAGQQALQQALADGVGLEAKVTWRGSLPPLPDPVPPGGKAPPPKKGKAVVPEDREVYQELKVGLSLQAFTEQGLTAAVLEGSIEAPPADAASQQQPPPQQQPPAASSDPAASPASQAASVLSVEVRLARPLVEVPVDVVPQLAPLDILPLRELVPKKPPRDVEAEFQKEIVDTIRVLSEEYVKSFVVKSRLKDLSLDDKRKRYFYLLNSTGVYHDLKEKLKPRIQRLVRKRFGKAPANEHEKDELASTLYSSLMEHVNSVINKRVKETRDANEDPIYEPPFPETQRLSLQRITELGMLADDAEANDQFDLANKHHEERVTIAQALLEQDETNIAPTLLEAWQSFGNFCLRVPLDVSNGSKRLRAREALKEALSISQDDNSLLHVYAALLLEEGQFEDARAVLQVVVSRSQASVLTYILLSLHADIGGDFAHTRSYLHQAVAAYDPSNLEDLGVPRRTAVVALLEVADYLSKHNLVGLTQRTLDVADKCEAAALDKARERKMQTVTPVSLRVKHKRLRAQTLLSLGQLEDAEQAAHQATEICSTDGWSWALLGEVKLKLARLTDAKAAYAKALDALTRAGAQVPPRVFMRLGKLYMVHADAEKAREVMLRCCAEHLSPSGWLQVGVACIKLNELEDAEDALQEANVLDNRNADVWGYLSLLLLLSGEERLHEATAALDQALKYTITNTSLLRELASAFISIDHLSTAEDLLRRSIALDPVPYTRRLLADVLASQNALAQAAAEYKLLLDSEDAEDWQRDDALQQYAEILRVLGREHELAAY